MFSELAQIKANRDYKRELNNFIKLKYRFYEKEMTKEMFTNKVTELNNSINDIYMSSVYTCKIPKILNESLCVYMAEINKQNVNTIFDLKLDKSLTAKSVQYLCEKYFDLLIERNITKLENLLLYYIKRLCIDCSFRYYKKLPLQIDNVELNLRKVIFKEIVKYNRLRKNIQNKDSLTCTNVQKQLYELYDCLSSSNNTVQRVFEKLPKRLRKENEKENKKGQFELHSLASRTRRLTSECLEAKKYLQTIEKCVNEKLDSSKKIESSEKIENSENIKSSDSIKDRINKMYKYIKDIVYKIDILYIDMEFFNYIKKSDSVWFN